MKLICIFLAATLALAAAKPYHVNNHQRDNDQLQQSHSPVEDLNINQQEINSGRKTVRPVKTVITGSQPTGTRGGSFGTEGGPASDERIIVGRPINEGYRDREFIIQGRPISGGYGGEGVVVGRPISGGYRERDPIIQGRPISEGYGGERVVVGRPISGGYREREPIIQGRPISGGYGGEGVVVGRPISGGVGHSSHLETEEFTGSAGAPRPEQTGSVKGGQRKQVGLGY